MGKRENININLYLTCVYLLIFQDLIQRFIPIFKYFDETLALLLIPVIIMKLFKQKNHLSITKTNLKIILSLAIIIFIGLLSNFIYQYQSIKYVLGDLYLCLKFFLVYFLSSMLWNNDFYEKYSKKIYFHVRFIIYMMTLMTILNYGFNIFGSTSYRFGIRVNTLFYSLPTGFAAICVFLMALLIRSSKKIISIELGLCLLMLSSTLRFKAIGAAVIIIIMTLYVYKFNKKISIAKLGVVGLIAFIVAFRQISFYYIQNDKTARSKLTTMSFQIAKDYFPLGTGFATYGSYMSAVSYSPVYYKYKLNYVYGLGSDISEFTFIFDTFWPIIIGQFGFIGFILYIYCLILIFKKIQQEFSAEDKYFYISKLICFIYLIVSSTSEAAFVHPLAIPLALLLGTEKQKS